MSLTKVSYSMIQGAYVNVLDYGADPTGVSDSWQAIQNAVDASIYGNTPSTANGSKKSVYIPAGIYKITDTIQLGYGTGFTSVFVFGDGPAYLGEAGFNGTTINASEFNDRPAFNIQGGRDSSISELTILGASKDYFRTISADGTFITESVWSDPSLPVNSYSQYASYAGVTVDAYSGVRPVVSYPDVPYPSWLGVISQYGKNTSSRPLLANVQIIGFVVAVVVQPSNVDSNGDFVDLNHCSFFYNKYAVSVGNSQSRTVSLIECIASGAYTFITNTIHGQQHGQLGGTILNCSVDSIANLFNVVATWTNGFVVQSLYGELVYRIGTILCTATPKGPIKFQSCQISMTNQNATNGVTSTILDGYQQPMYIVFENCFFGGLPDILVTEFLGDDVQFIQCTSSFQNENAASIAPYKAIAFNATAGFINGYALKIPDSSLLYRAYDNVTGVAYGQRKIGPNTANGLSLGIPSVTTQLKQYSGNTSFCPPVVGNWNVAKNLLTSITLVNKTLSITLAGGYTNSIEYIAGKPGDIIIDQTTLSVFFIRSRIGNDIIAELQNNYISNGVGGFNPVTAFSLSAGTFFFWNSRLFTPDVPIYGTFTNASNVITNVNKTSGFGTDIVVGTQLVIEDDLIAYNTLDVTSYDAAAKTITVSGNATRTITNKALPMWVALPPANV